MSTGARSQRNKALSPLTPVLRLTGWGQRMIADNEIPAHVDKVAQQAAQAAGAARCLCGGCAVSTTKSGRLLIVDDEAAQMRALCETLGAEGYTTTGFSSPLAALAALQPGKVDLLITDLMMPDMDGIALIAAVREIDKDIGAIVMTGHAPSTPPSRPCRSEPWTTYSSHFACAR